MTAYKFRTPQDYRDEEIRDFRARLAAAKTYDFDLQHEMEEALDYARKDVKDAYNTLRREKRDLARYERNDWESLVKFASAAVADGEKDLAGARAHRDELRDGLKAWRAHQEWSAAETARILDEWKAEKAAEGR